MVTVTQTFNVFVSYRHSTLDQPYIRELVNLLRTYDLSVWFDEDECRPGISFQKAMEEGIMNSKSGAVLIGRDGIGPWHDEEVQALLQLAVRRGLPVIPVLLPNAPTEPNLPLFLALKAWVDLRPNLSPDGLARLVWGITGTKTTPRPLPRSYRPISIDEYIAKRGHLIHKLKAKDSTGRWAYYFILVEPDLEQAFLQSLQSQATQATLDLEQYGRVVASCYGEEPTEQVRMFLKDKYEFVV